MARKKKKYRPVYRSGRKKGQSSGIGIAVIVGIILFMIGMMSLNFILPQIDSVRSSTQLNCDSPGSDGTKMSCLLVDLVVPYFIIIVISAVGGLITAKLLL